MKLSTSLLCLALSSTGALGTPIERRDTSPYVTFFTSLNWYITYGITGCKNAIELGYLSGPNPPAWLALAQGFARQTNSSWDPLTVADVATLSPTWQNIGTNLAEFLDLLNEAEPVMDAVGELNYTQTMLGYAIEGFPMLTDFLVSKEVEPSDAFSSVGAQIKADIQASIDFYSTFS